MSCWKNSPALVPPPRVNLIRYHGVLAPSASARDRDKIVPQQETPESPGEDRGSCHHHMPQRLAWAVLLARVSSIDISTCDRRGGRMRVIAGLTEPASIRRYLQGVGLPDQPPPTAPPRPPPQTELVFSAG